jgi:dolichol-phosphate mannosyltransferase
MSKTVILLPTYNERKNVSLIIPEIFAVDPSLCVLVVDDSSPDGTGEEVLSMARTYPNLALLSRTKKQGLGEAYKAGILQALADDSVDRILMMDADGSHAAKYLGDLLAASERYDLVIGSRYVDGGGIEQWEGWRYALSKGGNLYARMITGLPVKDLTAGFMCFRTNMLRKIDFSHVHASGYAFQMELKFCAIHTLASSFIEVPIIFKERREGESKISRHIVSEGLKTPWRLFYRKLISDPLAIQVARTNHG